MASDCKVVNMVMVSRRAKMAFRASMVRKIEEKIWGFLDEVSERDR
jgi:hypothetical protein